jgi:subtilisin-like proprotein convertase family protein
MPPLARLLALSITVALAALGAAPAAQAAVLPLAHATVAVVDSPHDGVVAGGDTLLITETVHNTDSATTLTGLTATLATQTAGVSIDQGSSAYPDIAAGADAANATPLQVTLDPSLPCGTTLHFTLTVTNGTGSAVVPFTVATGAQGGFADYTGSPAVIGETLPSLRRVLSSVSYAGVAQVSDPGIVDEVRVTIGSLTHPNISHLSLSLKAPDGTTVPLVDAGHGTAGQSFTGTELVGDPAAATLPATGPYTGTFKAAGDLSAMAGLSQQGDWRLFVSEPNDTEIGRVNSWTLRIAAASCAPRSVAKLTATPNPVDPGADVVLNAAASASADPGGITRYEWDLADGTGFHEGATPTTATRTVRFAQRGTRTVTVRVSDATGVIGTAAVHLIVSQLPNAIIGLPSGVKEQTFATLDGSGSNDPDGGAISSYEWETDGDDDFNDYTGPQPSVYFATPGSHTIKLRVTDGDGAQRTATSTLSVIATTPPSPSFVATPNPVVAGQSVTFDAGGSTDDGTIVRYEWDLDGNGSYETNGGASPLVTRSFPNATVMSIGVRATDDDGRTAVARSPLVVNAPAGAGGGGTGGGSSGSDPGAPDGSAGSGGSGGSGGSAGSGGSGGAGGPGSGGSSGAGAGAATLDASLDGASIQTLKLVSKKGLGLRCSADRAATCTVSVSLQAADARRLGLSKSKTKPYPLGTATVKLKKAGAAVVTVRLARRALSRLRRAPRVTVLVTGKAVDGGGGQVALRRAILIRR